MASLDYSLCNIAINIKGTDPEWIGRVGFGQNQVVFLFGQVVEMGRAGLDGF